jgi:hypothetical protein
MDPVPNTEEPGSDTALRPGACLLIFEQTEHFERARMR